MDFNTSTSTPSNPSGQLKRLDESFIYGEHNIGCNCCCCCDNTRQFYKYVQPIIPKSFAPIRTYFRNDDNKVDSRTIYNRSYWNTAPLSSTVRPFRPQVCLKIGDGKMAKDTTQKLSYIGNWYTKPSFPMVPCTKQWLGRGPISKTTTHKYDFTWKSMPKLLSCKPQSSLHSSKIPLSKNTTYNLSYWPSKCQAPTMPFKPIRIYEKNNDKPFDDCTTHKLSYQPIKYRNSKMSGKASSCKNSSYSFPMIPLENSTTYRLSYWPIKQAIRKPFTMNNCQNLLNAGCQLDDKTTYNLSYIHCGNPERRQPIKYSQSIEPSSSPLSNRTTHKLSYLGNWAVKPETPLVPCSKTWLQKNIPIENETTQKHDYTWKWTEPVSANHPSNNLQLPSPQPLKCCTIQKLSYIASDPCYLKNSKSFKPIRKYVTYKIPAEKPATTMKLSYQFVESPTPINVHRIYKPSYKKPILPCSTKTIYDLR